ncbi:sugar-transfer associated ATP-grasp domain-containing protein [Fodinibius salsisoli]|uniref:Alpha-L-glutamate ligase-related protein ATP-grasp domain-containing protein n=1 Tax=Fodinibius salsisoli TaxID=2820877 RepID=A0ABT3PLM7_9BACT|nr:sugar-transfer associated ATP-grasp domain-containing protein [Fodinibius salsisoli]MCW9706765.1 hypothetical protein [Fodinibius salsisoli]
MEALDAVNDKWREHVNLKMSRDTAKKLRKKLVALNGKTIINQELLKEIKSYCQNVFGNSSYWPWLAYYTELRGEFKEGWMPDDYYRFELLPKMNPEKFMRFSEAKIIDHKLFEEAIIDPLFFRTNGHYCGKDGAVKKESEIQHILKDLNNEVIIKPADGRGGQGIMFEHSREVCLDDLPPNTDLLFQEVLGQHAELNKLYPHSINTLRVLTFLNETGAIEVKFIVIRFGINGSRVDNASRGGGWIFVRLDGTVEPTAFEAEGIPIGNRHPDTGFEYSKLKLPFLPKVIELCKKAHHSFPYTRIIGWDVLVKENGEAKFIEWNANNPFMEAIEARFGPFFKDIILPE